MFDANSPDAFGAPVLPARFWAKVAIARNGCWLWQAALNSDGYGYFAVEHRVMRRAHRLAFEALVGPIEPGHVLDHVCRVRRCVNPEHLQPVTNRINVIRGVGHSARNARKTHCFRGHEFTEANTGFDCDGAKRVCRACGRENSRRYAARQRARLSA